MGRGDGAYRKPDGRIVRVWGGEELVDGVRVRLHFAEVDGRAVCARIELGTDFDYPDESDPVPLTTSVIRSIPFSSIIERAHGSYARTLRLMVDQEWQNYARASARLPAAERATEKPKKPGRPRLYERDHYEEIAAFVNAQKAAGVRGFVRELATRYGVSKSCAAKWVATAREMGLVAAETP